jgi:hypothetical protein
MKRLVMIGLDGLSWRVIIQHPECAPYLDSIRCGRGGWQADVLTCVSVPIHSAPSWSTICSGELNHGIYDFNVVLPNGTRGRRITRADIQATMVWERLAGAGIDARAYSIYATLPPTTYHTEFKQDIRFALTLTRDEMRQAMNAQRDHLFECLDDGAGFVAFVNITPDKAHHMSHKAGLGNIDGALDAYTMVDEWLSDTVEKIQKRDGDVLVLSDHGLPGKGYQHETGLRIPGHHPDGMIATTAAQAPPTTTDQVAPWILDYFEVAHDQPPLKEVDNLTGLTPDEEDEINDRLRALGYIE